MALENDFRLRQYLIENGMSVEKEDDMEEHHTTTNTTTALQIHQIDVIVDRSRTNRFREPDPPIRRNSATSSVSASTFFQNNRESNNTPSSTVHEVTNRFILPKPMIRPIQIKVEPADEPIEEEPEKTPSPPTISPSSSNGSGSRSVVSHITLISNQPSISVSSKSKSKSPIPMVVIPNSEASPQSTSSKEVTPQAQKDKDTTEKRTMGGIVVNKEKRTNSSVPATPTTPKKVGFKAPSPNIIGTRRKNKKEEEEKEKVKEIELENEKNFARNKRGLRPIKMKSLNEVKLKREIMSPDDSDSGASTSKISKKSASPAITSKSVKKSVENAIKATSTKEDPTDSPQVRKKKALENFLKHVSSTMKIKAKNTFPPTTEKQKQKAKDKPKNNISKNKDKTKQKTNKLKLKLKLKNKKDKNLKKESKKKLGRPRKYI